MIRTIIQTPRRNRNIDDHIGSAISESVYLAPKTDSMCRLECASKHALSKKSKLTAVQLSCATPTYPVFAATGAVVPWGVEGVALITSPFFTRNHVCLSDAIVRDCVERKPGRAEVALVASIRTGMAIEDSALGARVLTGRAESRLLVEKRRRATLNMLIPKGSARGCLQPIPIAASMSQIQALTLQKSPVPISPGSALRAQDAGCDMRTQHTRFSFIVP